MGIRAGREEIYIHPLDKRFRKEHAAFVQSILLIPSSISCARRRERSAGALGRSKDEGGRKEGAAMQGSLQDQGKDGDSGMAGS